MDKREDEGQFYPGGKVLPRQPGRGGGGGGEDVNAVHYTAETKTEEQKAQARANIGAGTSNFSGNYGDLQNKPTAFPPSAHTHDKIVDGLKEIHADLTVKVEETARTNRWEPSFVTPDDPVQGSRQYYNIRWGRDDEEGRLGWVCGCDEWDQQTEDWVGYGKVFISDDADAETLEYPDGTPAHRVHEPVAVETKALTRRDISAPSQSADENAVAGAKATGDALAAKREKADKSEYEYRSMYTARDTSAGIDINVWGVEWSGNNVSFWCDVGEDTHITGEANSSVETGDFECSITIGNAGSMPSDPSWHADTVWGDEAQWTFGPVQRDVFQTGKTIDTVQDREAAINDHHDDRKANEFSDWVASAGAPGDLVGQPTYDDFHSRWVWLDSDGGEHWASGGRDDTSLYFDELSDTFTATRIRGVLRPGLNSGGVPLDPNVRNLFFESNASLMGVVRYPLYSVPTGGALKDRAINVTSLGSVTVPDGFTDLVIRASIETSLSVTMPSAITTVYGDTFPAEEGEFLVTITKTGAAEAYVRTIKLEVANA